MAEVQTMSGHQTEAAKPGLDATSVLSINIPFQNGSLTLQIRLMGEKIRPAHIARARKYLELAEADLAGGHDGM